MKPTQSLPGLLSTPARAQTTSLFRAGIESLSIAADSGTIHGDVSCSAANFTLVDVPSGSGATTDASDLTL